MAPRGQKRRDLIEIDGTIYVSTKIAALVCGVTVASFNNWRHQDNPPPYHADHQLVPLKSLGEWVRQHQIFKKGRGGGGTPYAPVTMDSDEHPDIRLKRLQGDKVQMELSERARNLLPVDEIEPMMAQMITRVRTKLLRLGVATAPLVTGLSDQYAVQSILDEAVREALEDLAQARVDDDLELPPLP